MTVCCANCGRDFPTPQSHACPWTAAQEASGRAENDFLTLTRFVPAPDEGEGVDW